MIDIIYQHQDFIIIDKPAGLSVHSDDSPGVIPLLQTQLNVPKLWLVHRLDKTTSGLLIIATSKSSAAYFQQRFAKREIDKCYIALTSNKPKKKMGRIVGDQKKARGGQWMLLKSKENPAETFFTTKGTGFGLRLFLVKPRSGKTHQIRVALKSLGSPILGDLLYGSSTSDRLYLHAYALKFTFKDEHVDVTCQPKSGEYFLQISELLKEQDPIWSQFQSDKATSTLQESK